MGIGVSRALEWDLDGVRARSKVLRHDAAAVDDLALDVRSDAEGTFEEMSGHAIYAGEHPELRPLLDHPAGAEIFTGPAWNTRRRMRVGDTWNRDTDQIILAAASTST